MSLTTRYKAFDKGIHLCKHYTIEVSCTKLNVFVQEKATTAAVFVNMSSKSGTCDYGFGLLL